MSLPQQQLSFVPMELRLQPAFSCSFRDLQSIVQRGQGLFDLPSDVTCPAEEGDMMGYQQFRPAGAIRRRTAAQKRYPLRHIAILCLDPAAIDRSERTPLGTTLLGRHRNQLVYALIQVSVITADREPYSLEHQGRGQGRRMSQSPRLHNGCSAPCQCLVRKT